MKMKATLVIAIMAISVISVYLIMRKNNTDQHAIGVKKIEVLERNLIQNASFSAEGEASYQDENSRLKTSQSRKANNDILVTDDQIIEKAVNLVEGKVDLPDKVEPVLEHLDDFTVVYWPIRLLDEDLAPGPSKYAEVVFQRKSLNVIEILGAH